jgi:hypothetical protein
LFFPYEIGDSNKMEAHQEDSLCTVPRRLLVAQDELRRSLTNPL